LYATKQMTDFGETEPTEHRRSLVDEALYLRGRIVPSYAKVEFLLADLVAKLDLRFPYLIEARIKAVKRIAEREGYEIIRTIWSVFAWNCCTTTNCAISRTWISKPDGGS
jgi:hypothetical protein